MLSFKKYKKIYPTATFKSYLSNHVLYGPRRWLRIPYCTYMCIKYPFLYPRNRFTDKHYNNWKILDFAKNIYGKYCNVVDKNLVKSKDINYYYVEYITDSMFIAWKNWWAKPLWKVILFFHDYILQIFHCLPTYTEWDAIPKGWEKAFGKQYLKELKVQLKKDKMLYSFRIMDIKEKYGLLNLYCNGATKEIHEIIEKYEKLSWNTCINCGKPSTKISKGYILPYCDDCATIERHPYGYVPIEETNIDVFFFKK